MKLAAVRSESEFENNPLSESRSTLDAETFDTVLCLSHLRWDFVYQRPQHLMSRLSKRARVIFFEEPIVVTDGEPRLEVSSRGENISVVLPVFPADLPRAEWNVTQRRLLDGFLESEALSDFALWYYTPMALKFTDHLKAGAIVYDCMDELSGFMGAPTEMARMEARLLAKADVVFTGGQSLFEAKKHKHHNIHPFPSSVEVKHFQKARTCALSPEDQARIPGPRIGFFGVIDERMDLQLVDQIAHMRPEWNFVMLGPVVKIDLATLPRHPNLHYLGAKNYSLLPDYLSGWEVAILPFGKNEATRFISPTKTPEYLAAGCPVISTSIQDVVNPYHYLGLVRIADTAEAFVEAIELSLGQKGNAEWIHAVDSYLRKLSWDNTWERMEQLIESAWQASKNLS